MGLFDKIKNAIFIKEDSEAEKQLVALQELRSSLHGAELDKLEREISKVEAGIIGEKQVHFELENSHIPMYVLHDLFIEDEGLKAQIDYIVITKRNVYIIECKNLYGNIEINSNGSFIRSYEYKGKKYREGIYSPITQNERHKELIKVIGGKNKNVLSRTIFEKNFDNDFHTVVVLANPKTVLNDKYAGKEVKEKVIRADQLISYIKNKDASKKEDIYSEKDMERSAEFLLNQNNPNPVDYVAKYREMLKEQRNASESQDVDMVPGEFPKCPKCGAQMVLRTATKGNNIGSQFYGCSQFPKCRGIRQLQ